MAEASIADRTRGWGGIARAGARRETYTAVNPGLLEPADLILCGVPLYGHRGARNILAVVLAVDDTPDGYELSVLGLTTWERDSKGRARLPLLDWSGSGLRRPVWRFNLQAQTTPGYEAQQLIGRCSRRDAEALLDRVTLSPEARDAVFTNAWEACGAPRPDRTGGACERPASPHEEHRASLSPGSSYCFWLGDFGPVGSRFGPLHEETPDP